MAEGEVNSRAKDSDVDMKVLAEAFEAFTRTTQTMEESFRRLELRVQELDRELAEKNRELAFTSDYLNYVLESMSDGVIATDTRGVVTTFNSAASAILGYTREEVLGRSYSEVFDREFGSGIKQRVVEWRGKNGHLARVNERNSPISDREGKRIGTVKVFQDLSEIETLREQVRQKDRLAAIGEMAATVAHEIRNPLGGIRGFAALLARDIEPDDLRSRLVEKILQGAKDLDRVVTQLLEYTRPLKLRLRSTSCGLLVDSALAYIDPTTHAVVVDNEVPTDLHIMADPDTMRQVLLNILLNAVQSIQGNGKVRIAAETDDATVSIVIADTGCGIPAEHLERIFSPFFTTKEKGTGLGLALAAKIVEGHGGSLEAHSVKGAGSTFVVRLPRAE